MRNQANLYGIRVLDSITPYKGRELMEGDIVKVYRNLNKKGVVYSVVKDGKVHGHGNHFVLDDVTFYTSQTGRDRVIKEQKKNVHSFIRGRLTSSLCFTSSQIITYNPYKDESFKVNNKDFPLERIKRVSFTPKAVYGSIF